MNSKITIPTDFPFQYFPNYFDSKGLMEKILNQIMLVPNYMVNIVLKDFLNII